MTPNDYRLRHPRCRVKNKEMGCNDGKFCKVYKPRRFEG